MYNYCIWDFNGTLLDDIELGMESVNILLAERGLPVIPSRDAYRERFDFPIIDYYKDLGFDFSKEPYEKVAKEWVDKYIENLPKAKLFDGVLEALDYFDFIGVKQSVISASERSMLISQLEGLNIADRFEEILGIDNIYGDSKLAIAHDWKMRHPNEKIMFIGDTKHDCETAQVLGADCFIVCNGHQCRERICGENATVFDSLGELIEYLKKRL